MKNPIKMRTLTCPFCAKYSYLTVELEDYKKFKRQDRPLIQDVFPYLSDAEREMLITGTCAECWNAMYSFEDE